jgi:hypothetical protein
MTATYTNKALNETYKIGGVKDLEQAWNLANFACRRNNWNPAAFCMDVKVTVK